MRPRCTTAAVAELEVLAITVVQLRPHLRILAQLLELLDSAPFLILLLVLETSTRARMASRVDKVLVTMPSSLPVTTRAEDQALLLLGPSLAVLTQLTRALPDKADLSTPSKAMVVTLATLVTVDTVA